MVLSVLMVQTLTTLLEPPPAIGGTKGLSSTGQPHQPQANIAVFMFLFMLCAAEVVFIKLLALTSFGQDGPLTSDETSPHQDHDLAPETEEQPAFGSTDGRSNRAEGTFGDDDRVR